MLKISPKIFIPVFLFSSILVGILAFSPIKSEAAISPSLDVQIRKLERQVEKLKVILLNLQKAQALKKKVVVKPVVVVKPMVNSSSNANNVNTNTGNVSSQGSSFWNPPVSKTMSISALLPNYGPNGTLITIKGKGFSKTSNDIYTGYDIIKNVPSADGQTLSFTANAYPQSLSKINGSNRGLVKGDGFEFWVYVHNETGVSNPVMFKLTF